MNHMRIGTGLAMLCAAALLLAVPQPTQAAKKETYGAVGLGVGLLLGHSLTSHHYRYHHRPRSVVYYDYCPPPRVVHRPVYHYSQPKYYYSEPAPRPVYQYPSEGYYNYRESRVWPVYRSVESEYIPPLPPVQPANAQAVSLTARREAPPASQQAPVTINIYSDNARVEQTTADKPAVEEIRTQPQPSSARTITVSNSAGRASMPNRVVQATNVQTAPVAEAETEVQILRRQLDLLQQQIDKLEKQLDETEQQSGARSTDGKDHASLEI